MKSSERVAAYFDNELNEAEKLQFEQDLETNAELRNEYNFQNDIIEGIRSARKAELKAMLDNVPVGGGLSGGNQLMQFLGAAVVTAFIGTGIYYFWPENKEIVPVTETEQQEAVSMPDLPEEQAGTEKLPTDQTDEPVVESETAELNQPTERNTARSAVSATEQQKEESKVSISDARPTIPDSFDTGENSTADIPENNLADKSMYAEGPVEVAITTSDRKYNFHYQFMNGKLMLYGDFNETYEILDFMQGNERSVYLYYQGKYYSLIMTQGEVKKLEPITENSVIRSLDERRTLR